MRILQIVHGYPPAAVGGTEAYTAALSTALAAGAEGEVFVLAMAAAIAVFLPESWPAWRHTAQGGSPARCPCPVPQSPYGQASRLSRR
ncbi:MAG: hypothetical protein LC753_15000 [Acidobacteria bacterium]|nr:hypothetical protein [Acidobacteriota bacterium]